LSGIREQIVDDCGNERERDRKSRERNRRVVLHQQGGDDRDATSTQKKMKHGWILLYSVSV